MIGSFWGGGYQKNLDFMLELYKKKGRFYEFYYTGVNKL